jgi:hypothetical protein
MAVENDIVLIHFEDRPMSFARIEAILPDAKRDWYHVKLLLLQVPPQVVTWILKDVYIEGAEFTMNGKRMRLEKIEAPAEPQAPPADEPPPDKPPAGAGGRVISLGGRPRKT